MHTLATPHDAAQPEKSALECPATVRAPGIAAANAIVEHVTVSACRLRSVVHFELGTALSFDFGVPGRSVPLRGRVTGRVAAGPRFIYRLALEKLDVERAEALARAVADWYRHQEIASVHERASSHDEALTRAHRRVPTQFPVSFRLPNEEPKDGRASDISSGGLSISCSEPLVDGMTVELDFTPPSDVLAYVPESVSNRPFSAVGVRARVVWHRVVGCEYYSYGLAFVELSDTARHEIARYVQAMQYYKHHR